MCLMYGEKELKIYINGSYHVPFFMELMIFRLRLRFFKENVCSAKSVKWYPTKIRNKFPKVMSFG